MVNDAASVGLDPDPESATVPRRRPELLAPAGNWECARAAVENGADAIYFGLSRFNARMRADNFTEADLPALMAFLHGRGVRGYATFNTLIFTSELADAEASLRAIIAAGTDAAIVQDVGICRLIRRISPDFPIHASTQMTITSAAGVAFARELGCNLVVLARECSLKELAQIQHAQRQGPVDGSAAASVAPLDPLPLEVFVHGALCVAYSGQCLTSESLGGRSANRGECAQACRMPYELWRDGQPVPLGDRKYLLSPQDLAGTEVIPELIRLGLASFKIEGRLKTPEYVASITRVYRTAIDRCFPAADPPSAPAERAERYEMEMAFSRGLSTGWFRGINNQELVHARFGKKRGVYLGSIRQVHSDHVRLRLEAPLKPGDGVVIDQGHPENPEQGGRVYHVDQHGDDTVVRWGRSALDLSLVQPGDRLWKTNDPELDRTLRQSFEGPTPRFRRPLHLEAHGQVGTPLTLIARDELGHCVRVTSSLPLAAATTQPLTRERLQEQLGRLGQTPYRLGRMDVHVTGSVMLPMSELNRLRREAVTEMDRLRQKPHRWTQLDPPACATKLAWPAEASEFRPTSKAAASGPSIPAPAAASVPELIVLVRDLLQLDCALQQGVTTVYCEFEDPKKYRDAVQVVRHFGSALAARSRPTIWLAPPRITKSNEEWILRQVRSAEPDGYLVRNYDHLAYFADAQCISDFSLNVANPWTAAYFLQRFRLERITASYDLDAQQLENLIQAMPPELLEVTLHQHMPMFHMEHCVFCAFLSSGTDYTNCGRPCDRHRVELRDRVGARHPLRADAGCRNTVFNGVAQTGAEHAAALLRRGLRHVRLEFLQEESEAMVKTIQRYRQLLSGEVSGTELWRELKLIHQLGVTRGPRSA